MTTPTSLLTPGTTVWSTRLSWGLVSGTSIRDRYGVSGGELGSPSVLTVRKAASEYLCAGCRGVITRGSLHGSNVGSHYCASCVTATEPEAQFRKVA
jgi:hypothetical protein